MPELYAGSATIGVTEFSLPNNSTTLTPKTDVATIQIWLDLNAMAGGDEYHIRVYEKVRSAGTQRMIYQCHLVGAQSPPAWVSPALNVRHGWDVTVDKIAGTDRTLEWSIRSPGT